MSISFFLVSTFLAEISQIKIWCYCFSGKISKLLSFIPKVTLYVVVTPLNSEHREMFLLLGWNLLNLQEFWNLWNSKAVVHFCPFVDKKCWQLHIIFEKWLHWPLILIHLHDINACKMVKDVLSITIDECILISL